MVNLSGTLDKSFGQVCKCDPLDIRILLKGPHVLENPREPRGCPEVHVVTGYSAAGSNKRRCEGVPGEEAEPAAKLKRSGAASALLMLPLEICR